MKKVVLVLALLLIGTLVFAQVNLPQPQFVSGRWSNVGGRVFQNDENARLAKANVRAAQSGTMSYEFNVRYEGGAEDGHGGVGLHIFVDAPYNSVSWGAGRSYLLWLNYDENPISRDIPRGLSAQIYRSTSNSTMDLIDSISLREYENLLTDANLAYPISFSIVANGNNGRVDFDVEGLKFYYNIPNITSSLRGDWIVARTNGMKVSFGY